MDRNSFYYLYVNANSLAELAMQLLAEQILARPPPDESQPLSEDELNARVAASFGNIDLEALQNLDGEFSLPDTEADPQAPVETPPPVELSPEAAAAREASIARYLEKAYAHEVALCQRMDQYYGQSDLPALETVLSQLPAQLAPLTRALSPAEMSSWLMAYENGSAALDDVVVQMRQLDMAAE